MHTNTHIHDMELRLRDVRLQLAIATRYADRKEALPLLSWYETVDEVAKQSAEVERLCIRIHEAKQGCGLKDGINV